jgi:hypothetical protein
VVVWGWIRSSYKFSKFAAAAAAAHASMTATDTALLSEMGIAIGGVGVGCREGHTYRYDASAPLLLKI